MVALFQGYSSVGSTLKLIGLIILCIIIIIASFYTTKFVGKRRMGQQGKSNFIPIDIYRINQTKYLQLLKAGKKYIIIAVSKDNISFIAELREEDIVYHREEGRNTSFKDILASIGKKKDDKQFDDKNETVAETEEKREP